MQFQSVGEFLAGTLPKRRLKEVSRIQAELRDASDRYNELIRVDREWKSYSTRRRNLQGLVEKATGLAGHLSGLDRFSREALQGLLGKAVLDSIHSGASVLAEKGAFVLKQIQARGKPRNLAEERWVLETAAIFERAFGRKAKVWNNHQKGLFQRLLDLSRPEAFPRHGKLGIKQVDAILKRNPSSIRPILRLRPAAQNKKGRTLEN